MKRTRTPPDELKRLLIEASAAPWRPWLAERVHLRVCNRIAVIGIDEAMVELAFLFSNVGAVGSSILDIWSISSGVVIDTDLTPRLGALRNPIVPCAVIVHQDRAGYLLDVRFYFDPDQVFRHLHDV